MPLETKQIRRDKSVRCLNRSGRIKKLYKSRIITMSNKSKRKEMNLHKDHESFAEHQLQKKIKKEMPNNPTVGVPAGVMGINHTPCKNKDCDKSRRPKSAYCADCSEKFGRNN